MQVDWYGAVPGRRWALVQAMAKPGRCTSTVPCQAVGSWRRKQPGQRNRVETVRSGTAGGGADGEDRRWVGSALCIAACHACMQRGAATPTACARCSVVVTTRPFAPSPYAASWARRGGVTHRVASTSGCNVNEVAVASLRLLRHSTRRGGWLAGLVMQL